MTPRFNHHQKYIYIPLPIRIYTVFSLHLSRWNERATGERQTKVGVTSILREKAFLVLFWTLCTRTDKDLLEFDLCKLGASNAALSNDPTPKGQM